MSREASDLWGFKIKTRSGEKLADYCESKVISTKIGREDRDRRKGNFRFSV